MFFSTLNNDLGQGKKEARTFVAPLRLDPDSAAALLHDSLDHGQSQTRTGALRVHFLKYSEYFAVILRINPDAVVLDEKDRFPTHPLYAKLDLGDTAVEAVFDCILDQVLP